MSRAAFFDLDGTLVEKPSLERRFIRALWYERKIPAKNAFIWLKEAARLAPNGPSHVLQGNKAYLQAIRATGLREDRVVSGAPFFPRAIECIARHAANGDRIVLITGTLEFLAQEVARLLRRELAKRGCETDIFVCATRLEEKEGRWTGRVLGPPMFGEAKAIAAWWFAEKWNLSLKKCSAYGDGANDRWLLASVGKAVAVNPARGLRRIAERNGWEILCWRLDGIPNAKNLKIIPESAR
jgi:HAD superfamily hydrolase (TIGR01490 family)